MNFKLIFKTLLTIALLALLVIMGMNNRQIATLKMPPILPKEQAQPAALMYFAFFGIGFALVYFVNRIKNFLNGEVQAGYIIFFYYIRGRVNYLHRRNL